VAERLELTLVPTDPRLPEGNALLCEYFDEMVRRYQHRPATPDEVRGAMVEDPSDDLFGASGVFLIAYRHSDPVGCVGLRFRPDRVGEVTRMFVVELERRRGVGRALLSEVEGIARRLGFARLELDTRDDLVEARHLYLRSGFREVPAFNAEPYAEHWFAKSLT
jgi:GNAT superfamily N-acetyltransferase